VRGKVVLACLNLLQYALKERDMGNYSLVRSEGSNKALETKAEGACCGHMACYAPFDALSRNVYYLLTFLYVTGE
jgi:hypothetical protein